jgi:signal transduction histidine kinase/ligand-binding sensor domain-containing protein
MRGAIRKWIALQMKSGRRWIALGVGLLAVAPACWGQKASNWRVYKLADGMAESACISVTVSPQGKVVARHFTAPFVNELDGYSVQTIPAPESGQGRIYPSPGGQLWTVVPEGLREFRERAWVLHRVAEIANRPRTGPVIDPVPLCPLRQGVVLLLLADRLLEFNSEHLDQPRTTVWRLASQTGLQRFTGLIAARDGGLWISGARGLARVAGPRRNLKPESQWREEIAPEALEMENFQVPHEDPEGGITAVAESVTNHQKLAAYFDGEHWTGGSVGLEKLRQSWRATDQTRWAMALDVLLQQDETGRELTENEDISARQYLDLAIERSGNFWLATSEGLFRYAPLIWRSPSAVRDLSSPVHCLAPDAQGGLWFASGSRLYVLKNDQLGSYSVEQSGRVLQNARAAFWLKDGTLVIDAGDQLLRFEPGDGQLLPVPAQESGKRLRALGLLKDGSVCVQIFRPDGSEQNCSLQKYDGSKFETLPELPPAPAIGNPLNTIFAAQNGDLWVSGELGTACCHDREWHSYASADKTTPEGATCFAELADGRIWCGAQGDIWEFDGKNWTLLYRGFDRINALLRTRNDKVWVASNSGTHRFNLGAWVQNGVSEGLPSADVREIYEDQQGRLWAATIRGLSLFHPEADPDPPRTSVPKLVETIPGVPEGNAVTLTFTGEDKWKYTPEHRLLYSFRLDDKDWSAWTPFQDVNRVVFADLSAGKHVFKVKAMDRNCNVEPNPHSLDFAIVLPWYRETRLLVISCAGAAGALFFAGVAFNRHRQLVRSYAEVERKVTERTQQLELANRELMHSQKMNALGTLAAGIAHDFNNILSIIKGSAQIIEDNLDNPEKIQTRADRIRTVVEQGSGIVKAMLGFSRDSGHQTELCDLNAIVQDTLKLLGDRFLREVQVTFESAPALPLVSVSKDFVQQILLNFIFNAAESMPRNKQIRIATRLQKKLAIDLVLAPVTAEAYLSLVVQDFGCGIPPENLARIFEPFFTTKGLSAHRGTGLGLSMVYELAKKLGAGLEVESVVDEGSTFTLIIPLREAAHEAKEQA